MSSCLLVDRQVSVLSELTSTATTTGLGGVDEIIVGDGEDFVIAGVGDDKVNYRSTRQLVSLRCD